MEITSLGQNQVLRPLRETSLGKNCTCTAPADSTLALSPTFPVSQLSGAPAAIAFPACGEVNRHVFIQDSTQ